MEYTGKTVEQAIESALADLGIAREQAEIKVVEEGRGIFKKAKVAVTKKLTDNERAVDFVEKLFNKMGITVSLEMTENDEECRINVITADTSVVIGKRGETLDAVQYLACMYANKENEDFSRIVVDCEGYRAKRCDNLKQLAAKLAERAISTGKRVQLDPMNPYERRIVHAELQKVEGVTTESRGTDPNRCVVIYPKNRKFPQGGKPFNSNRTGERREGGFNRDRQGSGERREGGFNHDRNGGGYNKDGASRTGGYNRDRNSGGYNKDGASRTGGYNRDRNSGGFNRDRDAAPKKTSFGFGTFLGNVNDAPKENDTPKTEE